MGIGLVEYHKENPTWKSKIDMSVHMYVIVKDYCSSSIIQYNYNITIYVFYVSEEGEGRWSWRVLNVADVTSHEKLSAITTDGALLLPAFLLVEVSLDNTIQTNHSEGQNTIVSGFPRSPRKSWHSRWNWDRRYSCVSPGSTQRKCIVLARFE